MIDTIFSVFTVAIIVVEVAMIAETYRSRRKIGPGDAPQSPIFHDFMGEHGGDVSENQVVVRFPASP